MDDVTGENREKDESKAIGGYARARALSAERRREIAKRAVEMRWATEERGEPLPKAIYGSPDSPLTIGGLEIPCYVLEDGRRVLIQTSMIRALSMSHGGSGGSGGDRLVKFISGKALNSFVSNELQARTEQPIKFRGPNGIAYGYEATVLVDICNTVLTAREAGALQKQQMHIAKQCEILVRGFAKVGIIALVDEATGYQEIRDRQALQAILDKYLRKEFATWAKRFPDEFYEQVFRLRKWNWRGMQVNRPQIVANYTKDIVYARLAPGILKDLEARNPIDEKGKRKAKHHQWLTEDIGHPRLAEHLYGVVGLMRIADSWDMFKRMLDKAYPRRGDTLQLELFNDPIPDFASGK